MDSHILRKVREEKGGFDVIDDDRISKHSYRYRPIRLVYDRLTLISLAGNVASK